MSARSPLLDLEGAAAYLALPEGLTTQAIARRLTRLRVPVLHLGRGRAVRRADLDAVIKAAVMAAREGQCAT